MKKLPQINISEISVDRLTSIIERAKIAPIANEDFSILKLAITTLSILTEEIRAKNASIFRLKKLLFGASTEKTREVLKEKKSDKVCGADESSKTTNTKKRIGHGRNGVQAYQGAKKIQITHKELKRGDCCPDCGKGKVYEQQQPVSLIRVAGMAPINAEIYECEQLRCNCCGTVFTAKAPEGVGAKKYDESVSAMIGILKYSCGVPFNRLEKLQAGFGIPLPAGTQWDLIEKSVEQIEPAYKELMQQSAQAEVLHNDDTTMKILGYDVEVLSENRKEERKRTGCFTTGIIAKIKEGIRTALFYTGHKHAGENLAELLEKREKKLSSPIQMCDALSRNVMGELKTILANCMAHARRRFVDVVESFPEECKVVLEALKEVYRNDEIAREEKMTSEERLRLHQEKSAPVMKRLEEWLRKQFDEKKVEPNSTLGDAIRYMLKHWMELTLFLREPSAPLDNNICERALKKAILNRKNSYFYKTENGARVGDMYMSLIYTAELNGENSFEYLVALQRHSDEVRKNSAEWMPWNYRKTLANLKSGSDPP